MTDTPKPTSPIEAEVLATLRAAQDVGTDSTELAGQVTGFDLGYHFSPQRLGLLAPLRLRPGLRAVEVGCASGALTRALGEAGLRVLGVESGAELAAAARERCRDLSTVEVVRAEAEAALAERDPFDLALLAGQLERATASPGGPRALLGTVADALAEQGVLVLAVDNQFGLGHLLGQSQGREGQPWLGLTVFPGAAATPRSWTRNALSAMLAEAGLVAQRWMLPYPDYRLPRVVVDMALLERPDAPEVVDKLVRDPLLGAFGGAPGVLPGRPLHRLALAEGIAADVAPSFLVLAARSAEAIEALTDPGLAWLVSAARRPPWRRTRRLTRSLALETVTGGGGADESWLRQQVDDQEPWVPGRPLDGELLSALHREDESELGRLLGLWRDTCLAEARPLSESDQRHPYLPGRPDVAVLPPDYLDVHPGNVMIGVDGSTRRVDLEWRAGTGVDAELAMARGLLEFAREVHHSGAAHPWPADSTLGDLLRRLAEAAGLGPVVDQRWAELVAAEAALQELVTGVPAARVASSIEAGVGVPGRPRLWELNGGVPALHDSALRLPDTETELTALRDEAVRHQRKADELLADEQRRRQEVDHELSVARAELARLDRRLGLAFAELAKATEENQWHLHLATEARAEAERARAEADQLRIEAARNTDQLMGRLRRIRTRLDALEHSSLVRTGHRYLWPAARAARGVRDLALGRAGDEPDGILRRASRIAPGLASVLGRRVRRVANRDAGLRHSVEMPTGPVVVGRGQVVELEGWVTHDQLPVRSVSVVAGGQEHRATLGHPRPDVVNALGAIGLRVPAGSGIRARLSIPAVTSPTTLPLALRVELSDGWVATRPLPALKLEPASRTPAVRVEWPHEGPRVAICLATYRPDRRFLSEQIASLRAQTHQNWVCVLGDDASGPDTLALLRELTEDDDRFVVVGHERNVGFYRNFERVLQLVPTDAELVALCDQDDVWDPDKLAVLLEQFADEDVQLAYCDMRLVDEHGEMTAPSFWGTRSNQWTDVSSLLLLNRITGAASLFRADLLREQVLPFPPGTPSAFHDQWIAASALVAGRIAFVGRALQSYRQHANNVTGQRDDRLDDGLPGLLGLIGVGLGADAGLGADKQAELEAVVEYELRRVAQFAETLLLRRGNRIADDVRAELRKLADVEHRLLPLVELAARTEVPLPYRTRARPENSGAERRLLVAALRWRAQRGKRTALPPPAQDALD
ncbi:glycosyltransferase [Streptoalloteichus hindustanus]|uniref:Methyltransferase domain-containing protein n=1 Tax=Streptoalloteichus hindustanus TaxID=2017 RepID=A0A1M4V9J3_STRHI|nr:glycosyltransferase [Streptoalloteichus hindustanus]SHE65639.1 Methyltransferase domain-containing protein [Streptoalloteichus hindustanus]